MANKRFNKIICKSRFNEFLIRKDGSIHFVGDGLSANRKFYLNGVLVNHVRCADTRRGVIECEMQPPRPDKYDKRILTRVLHGRVDVVIEQ